MGSQGKLIDMVFRRVDGAFVLGVIEFANSQWANSVLFPLVKVPINFLLFKAGQATNTMTCSSGTTFNVGGSSATTSNLECTNTITGDYQATGSSCGNGAGSLIHLGFNTLTYGFTTYIQSCYDMVSGSVRYTRHPLPGQAIDCKYYVMHFCNIVYNASKCK